MESQKPRGFVFFLRVLHGAQIPLPSRAVLTLQNIKKKKKKKRRFTLPGPCYLYALYTQLEEKGVSAKVSLKLTCGDLSTDNTPGQLNYGLSIGQVGGEPAQGRQPWEKRTACQTDLGTSLKRENIQELASSSLPRSGEVFFVRVRHSKD